ncbi:PREDICTED: ICOS ligand-like [Cyprinodon variegatus]|uniref:ICOS ligand-like n=1 Tax=Cyprinodon variegatus TaxID=28743 RepID=UPI0007428F93|nr:PREDICTED: ICOS ligand-like [Cyprinodon variegatus]
MATLKLLFLCYFFYLFLDLFSVTATSQKNITASPGQNVSLPCRVPNNKPAFIVKWTRPDLEPEYVLLYRDEQLDPEKQHPSYQNRVDLQDRQMKDGDVSLVLKNLTTNDRGTYECRVFQREANGRKRRTLTSDPISSIFLDVAPPAGELPVAPSFLQLLTC